MQSHWNPKHFFKKPVLESMYIAEDKDAYGLNNNSLPQQSDIDTVLQHRKFNLQTTIDE